MNLFLSSALDTVDNSAPEHRKTLADQVEIASVERNRARRRRAARVSLVENAAPEGAPIAAHGRYA